MSWKETSTGLTFIKFNLILRQQQELFAQARQAMNEEFQQQQFGLQSQTIEAKQSSDDDDEY